MTNRSWRYHEGGTKTRVALWLHQEVGLGGTFTKADLREAFPGVEQIDRRMRDLRPEGWVIHTSRQDASLEPDELRLVALGARVWEPGRSSTVRTELPAQKRREILHRDHYACTLCGIAGGETYPERPTSTAVLSVSQLGDRSNPRFTTLCSLCRSAPGGERSANEVIALIRHLGEEELTELQSWIHTGRRSRRRIEQVWLQYLRLSPEDREVVARSKPIVDPS